MSRVSKFFKPYPIITAGDMSASGGITSGVTNIQNLDNIAVQVNWTGTAPVGTVNIEVSNDYNQDYSSPPNVSNTGHWVPITLPSAATVSASAGQIFIDLNQLAAQWIRVTYTRTSGSGSLNAYLSGKSV